MRINPDKGLKARKPRTDFRGRARKDGRLQTLLYLEPELILRLKHAVIDDNSYMYLFVETALKNELDRRETRLRGQMLEQNADEVHAPADIDPAPIA
jgi:hypothetical protein